MIVLHQYPAAFNLSSLSPFCLKVEFFLKLSRLPYRIQVELNPRRGPKGKMPFIVHQQGSVADSSFIINALVETHGLHHLRLQQPQQRAQAFAFKTMIEEGLYHVLLYSRWVDEEGYRVVEKEFLPLFPPVVGKPILRFLRRNLRRQSVAQGTGRHQRSEVYQLGGAQVQALAVLLGTRQFFFEEKLSDFDATCYAFLSNILKQPIESPLKKELSGCRNLCDYVARLDRVMTSRF
ncbi:MAG TPA: glutathione S-transferase family protein [Bacteriovoracaceae bacterium]|nr:glutathione S-transferase family protein [Bacteriovoracaceae bacterium]